MNQVLGAESLSDTQGVPAVEKMRGITSKALPEIFELVWSQRESVPVVYTPHPYKWNMVDPAHLLTSDMKENRLAHLIPLHDCVKIVP